MTTESQLSFEEPAFQDMSLGAKELNWGSEVWELVSSSVELKDFMCVVVTVRLLHIRCQDMTGE
jgi:hypothetical protein